MFDTSIKWVKLLFRLIHISQERGPNRSYLELFRLTLCKVQKFIDIRLVRLDSIGGYSFRTYLFLNVHTFLRRFRVRVSS